MEYVINLGTWAFQGTIHNQIEKWTRENGFEMLCNPYQFLSIELVMGGKKWAVYKCEMINGNTYIYTKEIK